MSDPRWDNLGLWTHAHTHAEAARHLALHLARATHAPPGARVLVLGFGFGAELPLYLEHLDAAHVTGLEPDPRRVHHARERLAGLPITLHNAPAHHLPHLSLEDAPFDAILALDNAYHFDHRDAVFKAARRLLSPRGVLAFTDLILRRPAGPLLTALAPAFDIPAANLLTAPDLEHRLHRAGFDAVHIRRLDDFVLRGFCRHTLRHITPDLRLLQRAPRRWTRFTLTAAALSLTRGAVGYALIEARPDDRA